MQWMESGSHEWEYAWAALAQASVNVSLPHDSRITASNRGEIWQYMGTTADGWHEFRHRCHPRTNQRELVRVEKISRIPMDEQELRVEGRICWARDNGVFGS